MGAILEQVHLQTGVKIFCKELREITSFIVLNQSLVETAGFWDLNQNIAEGKRL
jgi:hypothetical protein